MDPKTQPSKEMLENLDLLLNMELLELEQDWDVLDSTEVDSNDDSDERGA